MTDLIIAHQRLFHTKSLPSGDYSLSFIHCDEIEFRCFALEDTFNATKIAGRTRIPADLYELKLRKELTPLTVKHRESYKELWWFKANPNWWHIEITAIKNYSGVYYHSGIDDKHTLACVLPAYSFDMTKVNDQSALSKLATNNFYSKVHPILESGRKVWTQIKDEA